MLFGSIVFLSSLLFFHQIGNFEKGKIKTRAVKVSLLIELFFDIIPSVVSLLFQLATQKSLSSYAGQIISTLNMLNGAICAVMYAKIFLTTEKQIFMHSRYDSSKVAPRNVSSTQIRRTK
uniref:Uncharacterized protein n=1 Tax=Ditylenchus dipsaci TaxID=166011 RepID=A0A915DG42_9BILA